LSEAGRARQLPNARGQGCEGGRGGSGEGRTSGGSVAKSSLQLGRNYVRHMGKEVLDGKGVKRTEYSAARQTHFILLPGREKKLTIQLPKANKKYQWDREKSTRLGTIFLGCGGGKGSRRVIVNTRGGGIGTEKLKGNGNLASHDIKMVQNQKGKVRKPEFQTAERSSKPRKKQLLFADTN